MIMFYKISNKIDTNFILNIKTYFLRQRITIFFYCFTERIFDNHCKLRKSYRSPKSRIKYDLCVVFVNLQKDFNYVNGNTNFAYKNFQMKLLNYLYFIGSPAKNRVSTRVSTD